MQDTPKRFQCRHIFTDGHRCGSPCLRGEQLCYYHHTTRRPAHNDTRRRERHSSFDLPLPEDRGAIQLSIGEVLRRIAANQIDPKRAGLLLYGLQIASLNLPREATAKQQDKSHRKGTLVEEVVLDPTLGALAPTAELDRPENGYNLTELLLQELRRGNAAPSEQPGDEVAAPGSPTPEPSPTPTPAQVLPALEASCVASPSARSSLTPSKWSAHAASRSPRQRQPPRTFRKPPYSRPDAGLARPSAPSSNPLTIPLGTAPHPSRERHESNRPVRESNSCSMMNGGAQASPNIQPQQTV